jgi:DNA-binding MarR family transcriptional regulator
LLDGLEARGWVQRSHVEGDRRGVNLELTKAGKTALRHTEKAMTAHLDEVLGSGDATQADAVVEGLLALSAVLKVRALARR